MSTGDESHRYCHVYSPVPVDRLPVLLIANSQNIQATSLSGTTVHSLLSTTTKQTTAMDFLYAEETVCWIHVGDSPPSTHLKCAKIPNLKSFTEERIINISLSLHRECINPGSRGGGVKGWGRLSLLAGLLVRTLANKALILSKRFPETLRRHRKAAVLPGL